MVEVWLRSNAKKKLPKIQLSFLTSCLVNNVFIIYSECRMLPLVDGYLVLVSTVLISGEEGEVGGRLTVVRNKLFYTV